MANIPIAYCQCFVVLLVRNVQFGSYIDIFHGHQVLVFAEGFFHDLNGCANIVGFIVTPKEKDKINGTTVNTEGNSLFQGVKSNK